MKGAARAENIPCGPGPEVVLATDRLSKSFGAVSALRDVSLSLARGEIRAVCGENGAGKSTLVKILMGVYQPDSGSIAIDGVSRDVRSPQMAQALGLALVAQELSLAPHLSILDNIWLGSRHAPFFFCRRPELRVRARQALQMLDAGAYDLDAPVGALTIGQRQIVEVARLLARDARVLILDEPTATLTDVEIERLFGALKALKAEGRSVLYITHRLGEVFEVCDTVTVLRNGEHAATHGVGEINRERLIELMLGRPFEEMYPEAHGDGESAALVVEGLSVPGVVHDFSLTAPRGKIVCIAGQVGSGANMVIRALAGLVPGARGRVFLNGALLDLGSVPRCLERQVLFVPEDRAGEGLFHHMRVLDNLVATRLGAHARLGVLSWPEIRRVGARLAERVRVDRQRLGSSAIDLSGGNQQKLLFGRALERTEPGVLLMNEPTHGVDVGARAEIYRLMREFCDLGYVLVMTSSDLEEVVGMADVVITMYRGRAVGRYERGRIAMPSILADITHPAALSETVIETAS